MRIDRARAKSILEEEVRESRNVRSTGPWIARIQELSAECNDRNKTFLAMLGTALLAKATHLTIDPFSLQAESGDSGYSARSLCTGVLAAHAPRLGIDLGVNGREPLNNQPFFGKVRVTRQMNVHPNARRALEILCNILDKVADIHTDREARAALRAFLQVRVRQQIAVEVDEGLGANLQEADLLELVRNFVALKSENGKRAQSVVAGLCDALVGVERVVCGKVNDPSRRMPGDVGIKSDAESEEFERVFEVRDKPVTEADAHNFIEKSRTAGIFTAGIVAVSSNQEALDRAALIRWAETRQVRFGIYIGWERFVNEVLFWSKVPGLPVGPTFRFVLKRLISGEVSSEGVQYWKDHGA